jgi:hypothetical protein
LLPLVPYKKLARIREDTQAIEQGQVRQSGDVARTTFYPEGILTPVSGVCRRPVADRFLRLLDEN